MLRVNRGPAVLTAATLAAVALLAASTIVGRNLPSALAATTPVAVTINTRAGLATMPATGLGANHAIWDANLGTPETTDLLKAAGVRMVRYPGGSYGDIYHWQDHTAPGGYVAPNTDFDTFIAGARRTGAEPMVIANYGTGTPEEAAAWVRQANITKGYGVRYWSIGNENYGNGHYGANWEADNHADKSPTGYANLVVAYADAMKEIDPSIKIGAVLTMPANWPDGLTGGGDTDTWNNTVLTIAGTKIDYVDVHWYPSGNTTAEALAKPAQLTDAVYLLREKIARYAGPDSSRIGIALTEFNIGVGKNTQPGALFLAESYATLLAQGVFTVQWWNVHNGIGTASTVGGQLDYDDFGLLSSGNCLADGVTCEPPLNTPFAPYYSLSLVNAFVRPGDQFVRAATNQPLVSAHAARRPNGDLAVLLINNDPGNSFDVSIDYAGFTPAGGAPLAYAYTNGASSVSSGQSGSATSRTLPPYSLTALVVKPSRTPVAGQPGTPGQPTVSAVTDRAATISWPAASAGSAPIAKYEVYRQFGAVSEQLGETPSTSFAVGNLQPGTRYTVNVLTRDTAGNVSWSSPPLEFMTGSPATSTCAVKFTDANDWGNGYVASIDITNNGPNPIDGWTLDFTWPTPWQQLSGGWNGNWAQTGTAVRVTNADFNRSLAAGGGSANIGFVAGYNGPNILPVAFRLNGTLCTAR